MSFPVKSSAAVLLLMLATVTTGGVAVIEAAQAPVTTTTVSGGMKSVLERFRVYNGKRTPKALTALFDSKEPGGLMQQPPVALSDGVTPVTITVKVDTSDGRAPGFSSDRAKIVSTTRDAAGDWKIEAIPDAGTIQSTVLLLTGGAVKDLPLTVAPPLAAGTDLRLAAFSTFLTGNGSNDKPLRDLNGDTMLDYQDDYIFTANFLVKQRSDPHSPAARQRKARELTLKKQVH